MLAPRASSAFVCLRCELTLARPRLPILPRGAPHASFSTSNHRRDAFDEEFRKDKPRPKLSEHPLGRVRRRKGRAIRETTARLDGTKTLGEDASILVLEELGGGKKKEDKPQAEVVRDEIPLNLADAIADEKPATLEEVVDQLDRLRHEAANGEVNLDEGNFVHQAVFVKLSDLLLRAFTSPQLSHYYSIKKNVGKDRVAHQVMEGVKQLQGKAKRPAERSEWTPGTTQIDRRLPSLDVHRAKKRKPISKHLLVDQILRDVWKLEMLEELEAAGELELALKGWQLALLTSGATETPLDRIGKARMAKLEISATDKVLRITADKHTAEYAADDVEQLLQTSEAHRFHFKPWIPHLKTLDGAEPSINDVFSDEILRTVATLTGAYLQRATDLVIIRALDKDTVAEAERCLIKLMPLKDPTRRTVNNTGILLGSNHFLPVTFEKETVDYKLRNAKLGRWSFPVSPEDATVSESDAVAERMKDTQEHVVQMASTLSSQSQRSSSSTKNKSLHLWPDCSETKMKAKFGHLLFPLRDQTAEQPCFIPALPGLSSMFSHESFKLRFITPPALSYDFIAQPGPKNYTTDLLPYQFPRLSISFRPDSEDQHKLAKVVLSFGDAKHQVLLPEKAVDISFETNQTLHMNNVPMNAALRSFRDEVLQNLRSGGRLSAPDIDLDIPKWTVNGMEFSGKDEMTRTRYLFTGIKVTQSIWGSYRDNPVSYVTNQSGKLGAKHGTFTMPYGLNENSKRIPISDHPKAIEEFVADTFKMADRITEAATANQGGMKKVERKLKTRKSADKTVPPVATEDETAPTVVQAGDVVSQTLNTQDAPTSRIQSDDEVTSSNTDKEVSSAQVTGNDIKTSARLGDDNEISHDTQTPEDVIEDPYISSMLNDSSSSNNNSNNDTSLTTAYEEPLEGEQKRRLASSV